MRRLDAASLISAFATGTYEVTRRSASSYTHGRAQVGPPERFDIVASVQPASARELERLPEGRRSRETRTVYTATRLQTGSQGGSAEADRIAIDGAAWEVQSVETWPAAANYYKCVVQAEV